VDTIFDFDKTDAFTTSTVFQALQSEWSSWSAKKPTLLLQDTLKSTTENGGKKKFFLIEVGIHVFLTERIRHCKEIYVKT